MNCVLPRKAGISLIDIMIVVLIIGMLSGISVPLVARSRRRARDVRFLGDMRTVVQAFEQYSMLNPGYPRDTTPGLAPPEILEFLPRFDWSAQTPIGGRWDWDRNVFGVKAAISVYQPERSTEEMAAIDKQCDDGSLGSGIFRERTSGFMHIIEE